MSVAYKLKSKLTFSFSFGSVTSSCGEADHDDEEVDCENVTERPAPSCTTACCRPSNDGGTGRS